jgi:hypothetical protein
MAVYGKLGFLGMRTAAAVFTDRDRAIQGGLVAGPTLGRRRKKEEK